MQTYLCLESSYKTSRLRIKSKTTKCIPISRRIHQVQTKLRLKEVKDEVILVTDSNSILSCTNACGTIILNLLRVFTTKITRTIILSFESDHIIPRSMSLLRKNSLRKDNLLKFPSVQPHRGLEFVSQNVTVCANIFFYIKHSFSDSLLIHSFSSIQATCYSTKIISNQLTSFLITSKAITILVCIFIVKETTNLDYSN